MATRRRIPMVGDSPRVVVPVQEPRLEVTLRARKTELSSKEAEEFDWISWSGLMIAALVVPKSTDSLVEYWKANANMLDWAKKIQPEIYESVRVAFSERKKQIQGDGK